LQSSFTINQKLKLTLFHKSSIKQPDQGKLTQYNESQDNQNSKSHKPKTIKKNKKTTRYSRSQEHRNSTCQSHENHKKFTTL
jgi:hypothetical protein